MSLYRYHRTFRHLKCRSYRKYGRSTKEFKRRVSELTNKIIKLCDEFYNKRL